MDDNKTFDQNNSHRVLADMILRRLQRYIENRDHYQNLVETTEKMYELADQIAHNNGQ